uniref:Cytosolic Fe-S cluster assembly factor NUBP1 homolog n=1 Tax=Syphacia muris TaxID=451379 RepID=A0A0N5AFY6_9BILA
MENANENCPGPGSENAGKIYESCYNHGSYQSDACAGCPNQAACASGVGRQVDPDIDLIRDRLANVKNIILVLSGKGGVGKSSFATNLARAIAADQKLQVGLLDVDICGPSLARMLGVENEAVHESGEGWSTVYVEDNLSVMSIAFLLNVKDDAVIWRGPRKNQMIKKFLADVNWGELDYLIIDTPPGTSDEHISLVQYLQMIGSAIGAILVTTPQEVSLQDVRKEVCSDIIVDNEELVNVFLYCNSVNFCRKTKVNIIGVVENMSSFICPCCGTVTALFPKSTGGAEGMCKEMSLRLLKALPLDTLMADCLDNGENYLEKYPNSCLAQEFMSLANILVHPSIFMAAGLKRVVITGIGIVSPFGIGRKVLFENLLKNNCALKYDEHLKAVVGRVPEGHEENSLDLDYWRNSVDLHRINRGCLLALIAAKEAIKDSGLNKSDLDSAGLNIGMGIADLELIGEVASYIRQGKQHKVTPYFVPRVLTNMAAGLVSIQYGMHGPNLSSSTACATGLNAIGDAATFIAMGRCDYMIAGGTEACVNPIAVVGFQRLRYLLYTGEACFVNLLIDFFTDYRALTSKGCRPFDRLRDGFGLSEGAGLVVLENFDSAVKRGAKIYAEINGYGKGVAGDAYHLTATSEDGIGATLSMQRSVNDSKISADSITYVNAHATSTIIGDAAEANAIAKLFPGVHVSSFKGHIGHTLGAAGAIETAIVAMAIKKGVLIGTAGLSNTDITTSIHFLKSAEQWIGERRALVNSFGFGGPHATLCLSQIEH